MNILVGSPAGSTTQGSLPTCGILHEAINSVARAIALTHAACADKSLDDILDLTSGVHVSHGPPKIFFSVMISGPRLLLWQPDTEKRAYQHSTFAIRASAKYEYLLTSLFPAFLVLTLSYVDFARPITQIAFYMDDSFSSILFDSVSMYLVPGNT